MTRLVAMLALSLSLSNVAHAKGASAQQEKMKACNKEAGEKKLKGDERKAFMKTCLSAEAAPAAEAEKPASAQQQKMKDCNKEAGEKKLKGDERKAFMKTCLSAKKAE